jgi:hypothetical protein
VFGPDRLEDAWAAASKGGSGIESGSR